jgi:predicted ATP-binding protein involved in virulence
MNKFIKQFEEKKEKNKKQKNNEKKVNQFLQRFLKRQQIDNNKFLQKTHQIDFIRIENLSKLL